MDILQQDLQPLFSWIDTTGLGIFTQLEQKFQGELPTALNALTNGFELFARTINLAAEFTGGFLTHLDDFLARMNGADWSTWSGEVEKLINDFYLWDHFIVILVKDIADLFSKDVGTVHDLITYLTNALTSLHTWINSTTGSADLQTIFEVHKQQIMDLLPVIGNLLEQYGKLFFTVAPYAVAIMDALIKAFGDFLTVVEKLGPLGDYAIALTLIAAKLGVMPTLFKAAFATDVVQGSLTTMSASFSTFTAAVGTKLGLVGTDAAAGAAAVGTIGAEATTTAVTVGEAATAMAVSVGSILGPLAAVALGFEAINKLLGDLKTTAAPTMASLAPTGNLQQAIAEVQKVAPVLSPTDVQKVAASEVASYQQSHPLGQAPSSINAETSPGGITTTRYGPLGSTTMASVLAQASGATSPGIPSGAGVPPTGPTTASQAAATAAQQAAAAAQRALAAHIAAITQEGQSTMARLVADIHSQNMASLRSAVIQTHSKGFEDLITSLDSIHTAEGDKLASQLTGLEKESVTARNAELKAIDAAEATARVNATVTAMDTIQAAQLKAATDLTNASIQFAADANKMANDAAAAFATLTADASAINTDVSNSIVTAITDQTAVMTDNANAQVQAIQDNSQLLTDQMSLSSLTGTALAAQQAQVAYDIAKQTADAKVAADQLALDIAKQTVDAQVNADTIALAQQKAGDDAAIAAATQHADQVTMIQDQNVNTAQEQLDTASINAQAVVNAATIANAVADAGQNKALQAVTATALQNATNAQTGAVGAGGSYTTAYTNAVNVANSAIGNANAVLAAVQATAQVTEGLLTAILNGDTAAGNVQIALLQQQLATDTNNENIALAGFQATVQQLNEANNLAQATATATGSTAASTAATAAATTPAAATPIVITVVSQIDGQQVALTTTPLIRQELLRTGRQTQNIFGGSAGRLIPS